MSIAALRPAHRDRSTGSHRLRNGLVPRSIRRDLEDPLFRNGHALVLSYVATSGLGLLYWVLAARSTTPANVGRNAVAINTLVFIGTVAQLNIVSALARFIQPAGRQTRKLVLVTYALSAVVAVLLGVGFLAVALHVSSSLVFLGSNTGLAVWFVISCAVQAVMVLEDGVLTGLRETRWVPVENGGFSLLKAAVVLPLGAALPVSGIFWSWTGATLVTVILTNVFIFGRAIPRHHARSKEGIGVTSAQLYRFVPYDFLGQFLWLILATLLPLYVIQAVGASASAYYSLDWVIASSLCLVSIGIGLSMTVETAMDQSELEARCRQVVSHLFKLLLPAVVVIVVFAPEILRLYGPSYAAHGVTPLRLMTLAALPFVFTATAASAARALQRTKLVVYMYGALFVIVVPLVAVLVPHIGIAGTGVAWLVGQTVVAIGVLGCTRSWRRSHAVSTPAEAGVAEAATTTAPVSAPQPALPHDAENLPHDDENLAAGDGS